MAEAESKKANTVLSGFEAQENDCALGNLWIKLGDSLAGLSSWVEGRYDGRAGWGGREGAQAKKKGKEALAACVQSESRRASRERESIDPTLSE